MPTTRPRPVYLSPIQAAEFLGWHKDTVRRKIQAGELKAYRLGKHDIRVRLDDVEKLLRPIETGDPR
jgi:excisionase family DNA binding protein